MKSYQVQVLSLVCRATSRLHSHQQRVQPRKPSRLRSLPAQVHSQHPSTAAHSVTPASCSRNILMCSFSPTLMTFGAVCQVQHKALALESLQQPQSPMQPRPLLRFLMLPLAAGVLVSFRQVCSFDWPNSTKPQGFACMLIFL